MKQKFVKGAELVGINIVPGYFTHYCMHYKYIPNGIRLQFGYYCIVYIVFALMVHDNTDQFQSVREVYTCVLCVNMYL